MFDIWMKATNNPFVKVVSLKIQKPPCLFHFVISTGHTNALRLMDPSGVVRLYGLFHFKASLYSCSRVGIAQTKSSLVYGSVPAARSPLGMSALSPRR